MQNSKVKADTIRLLKTGSLIVAGAPYQELFLPYMRQISVDHEWILLSDSNVFALYGHDFTELLQSQGNLLGTIVFPAGEEHKNLATLDYIYQQLVNQGADRHTAIIALGGGVVGDMAGLAAATYMRGVDVVQVPTTLMAQIDSSIGGKTGVNLTQGKNLVGSFHHPRLIFIDPAFLGTLKPEEYRNGLSELLKYALLSGPEFFHYLENERAGIKKGELDSLYPAIQHSIKLKTELVEQDEQDRGVRQFLNLGHTLAHALESVTHYRQYTHGQAVSVGLIFALHLSESYFHLDPVWHHRTEKLLQYWQLPVACKDVSADRIRAAMQNDKKNISGTTKMVLLKKPGQCQLVTIESSDELINLINRLSV